MAATQVRSTGGWHWSAGPTALLLAATLVMAGGGVAVADDTSAVDQVTASETAAALSSSTSVLDQSTDAPVRTDADSAAITTTNGTTVDMPKDASDGVAVSSDAGGSLTVTPVAADNAGPAKAIDNGVVAYPSDNGASTAAQATEGGGVRFATVISSADGPEDFSYQIAVPDGGSVALTDAGGATVSQPDGTVVAAIDAPWAKDASGNPIRTWFTSDGMTLTQHVAHRVDGVVYPVSADPAIAIVGAVVMAAAHGCAWNAGLNLVWAGGKWAILSGNWWWRQRFNAAVEDCIQGAVFGWAGRFIPGFLKQAALNSIRPVITQYLLWVVRTR